MKKLALLTVLLIMPLILAACGGVGSTAPAAPEGPALIMFYTEG
ncbi:MAG: hypothetical protein R3293_06155 [Candidatus Promineifilaceae bacterium]|nr:hypothetical protein [Candidatus Promineifilaceae bacterium]